MNVQRFLRKLKTPLTAAAVVICALLFFGILANQEQAVPDNPMEQEEADASRMYLLSSALALDESLLTGVENANISTGGTEKSEVPGAEDQQDPEEREEQEEKEEQQGEDEEQQETEDEPKDEVQQGGNSAAGNVDYPSDGPVADYDSLASLIQKNNPSDPGQNDPSGGEPGDDGSSGGDGEYGEGGNEKPITGGNESNLTPEESMELFTTSITDGETVTDPAYFFNITLTEKGKAFNLVSQTVSVNGSLSSFQNGDSVTLSEGANKILVTLRFRDQSWNQIDAPTKAYTVYYIPASHYYLSVENVKTGEILTNGWSQNVTDPELPIRVHAKKGQSEVNARVRLNNASVARGEDGVYRMELKVGANTLKVTAGSGVNQQIVVCYFNYQPDAFSLSFESEAITEKIQGGRFGGTSRAEYASDTEQFAFRVSCSNVTGLERIDSVQVTNRYGTTDLASMAGGDGYIRCDLEATSRGTSIKVGCTDSEGNAKSYTWVIKYVRKNTPDSKKPVLQVGLADGETVTASPYIVPVSATDYQGNKLYPDNIKVYLNGEQIDYSGFSGAAFEYTLWLYPGENTLRITVTDDEQYSCMKEYTVYYETKPEEVSVTLVVEANNIGLTTWIQETISVPGTLSVAQVLEQRLAAYGFETIHSGSDTDGAYYLAHIRRPGLIDGWHISEERRVALEQEGYSVAEPSGTDSLGEFDFTSGSGWMITLNNYFIGQGMGTRAVRDGDVIHVGFTLNLGKDLGGSSGGDIYG